jgi:hypothetical protein
MHLYHITHNNDDLLPLDQERAFRMVVDIRMHERNVKYEVLQPATLADHITALPDLALNITKMGGPQPAVGSFDADALQKVQQSFKKYTSQK